MAVYFTDPTIQRQGVVAGFVLSAPDYAGTPPETGAMVTWSFVNSDITVLGVKVNIGTGYQHWVNIGGAVFAYVQQQNSGQPNNTDSAAIVVAALANAINSAADALAMATAVGAVLELTPRQNTGAAITVTASASAYPNNLAQTLFEITGNELVPTISKGLLFAQGTIYAPSVAPILPAAPASQQSWLFYSSGTGWYWKSSSTPNASDDACVGWVRTEATAVVAVSSRRIGTGEEAEIIPAGPGTLAMATSAAGDMGVPPAPSFAAAETSTQLLLGDLAFASAVNTAGIDFATFVLYYVSEATGTSLLLTAAMAAGDTALSASAALPHSTPGAVTFTFVALQAGLIPIGPGYQHNIEIGAQTYAYVQQTEDTPAMIAQALANVINASPDPNAIATAVGATVVLSAAQNTGASVPCGASDGNTPQALIETMPTYVVIDQEIIQVNAANGSAIVRGQKGSTAAAHAVGAQVWPVLIMSQVFALPALAYGTPAWPTVVGQIPFTGNALVAADCWVANEIGPSPTTTECFSGQGPFAVDQYGQPMAPDVAGFTATVTTGIGIAGQPYYQFSGTVTMPLAMENTAEIDVVMTDANGTARTVYKCLGPFTANAVVNWASIPYPQPTSGPNLVFTPTVVPLNPDLAPTVSAHQPGVLTVGNGTVGTASTAPNVTATCSAVSLGGGNFGITAQITLPTSNPNYALLQAGSITVMAGWAGAAAATVVTETAWGSASTINIVAGTPVANSFAYPATGANFVVQFLCAGATGGPVANPFTVTLKIAAGAAPAMAAATATEAYPLIGNVTWVNFSGALTLPASLACLSEVDLYLQITQDTSVTMVPYAAFPAATLNSIGAGRTLNYGPAQGNTTSGIQQPLSGSDLTVAVVYLPYNAEGTPGTAVTIQSFTVYVSKVTAVPAPTINATTANSDGQPLIDITVAPTVYHPEVYGAGTGAPGSGALVTQNYLSCDGGSTWFWMNPYTMPTASSAYMLSPIYAPTAGTWTCKVAVAVGWGPGPGAYAVPLPTQTTPVGPIAAANLPAGAAISAAFTVGQVGNCPATDITSIQFVNFGGGGAFQWWLTNGGVQVWTWNYIQASLPSMGTDPLFWQALWTMQWGSYVGGVWTPDPTTGTETPFGEAQVGGATPTGAPVVVPMTLKIPGSLGAAWGYPAPTAVSRVCKFRMYAGSTAQVGAGGSFGTLQSGWSAQSGNTSSGSSWDITLPVNAPSLDMGQVNPATVASSIDAAAKNITLTGITGTYSVGDAVTGHTSGATGTVASYNSTTKVVGVMSITGTFAVGELLNDSTSGASGTISAIAAIMSVAKGESRGSTPHRPRSRVATWRRIRLRAGRAGIWR